MLTPAAGSPDPAAQAVMQAAVYNGALGIFIISWAFLVAIFWVATLRINIVLAVTFFRSVGSDSLISLTGAA